MTLGFRILPRTACVTANDIDRFKQLPVANVSDAMNRMFACGANLRPMHSHGTLAGPAITIRMPPGDNLMLQKAIDLADAGDILVVDTTGDLTHAVIGELMLAHAIQRGIAGLVINGAIRDSEAFTQRNLPTYAAGITHLGPYKNGPGEINVPVSIGGMVIHPGDLVLGDADGVVCVPREQCEEVYRRASSKHKAEQEQLDRIAVGRNNREWVDEALRKAGYDFTQ